MINNAEILSQIAFSLSRHYECVYYVNLETNRYIVFSDDIEGEESEFPSEGIDFFADYIKNAEKFIHPDDIQLMIDTFSKDSLIESFKTKESQRVVLRAIAGGKITHMRHVVIKCEDGKHILCCLENIEKEFREKEKQKKNLKTAELLARRDELTGVKNNHSFKEHVASIDDMIGSSESPEFGVVMCDINDLKHINDTRGHSYGNEAIQAASRLICETFQHSPVFRIGGDEFAVILTGKDYNDREYLLNKVKDESEGNRKAHLDPVVAFGMSVYENEDKSFSDVLDRADKLMYEDKNAIKAMKTVDGINGLEKKDIPIPVERKHILDAFFGALVTVSGGGYVYLNDLRYDFSRWSVDMVDELGFKSEYSYHADKVFKECIHPDDVDVVEAAMNSLFSGEPEVRPIRYRARRKDGKYVTLYTRGFVISDSNGEPEYFGGIILSE